MTREQWNDRCTNVDAGLWVGEVAVRAKHDWMREIGITNVVSILTKDQAEVYDVSHPVPSWVKHTTFNYGDHDEIPADAMQTIVDSIEGKTLLHCISGANRSTAATLCYLMSLGYGPIEAFNLYLRTRGMFCAKVYSVPPRMSPQMVMAVSVWMNSSLAVT